MTYSVLWINLNNNFFGDFTFNTNENNKTKKKEDDDEFKEVKEEKKEEKKTGLSSLLDNNLVNLDSLNGQNKGNNNFMINNSNNGNGNNTNFNFF